MPAKAEVGDSFISSRDVVVLIRRSTIFFQLTAFQVISFSSTTGFKLSTIKCSTEKGRELASAQLPTKRSGLDQPAVTHQQ